MCTWDMLEQLFIIYLVLLWLVCHTQVDPGSLLGWYILLEIQHQQSARSMHALRLTSHGHLYLYVALACVTFPKACQYCLGSNALPLK